VTVTARRNGNKNVRGWSFAQRIKRSREMRGHNELSAVTPSGRMHYELVRHYVDSYRLEQVLSFEAWLNNVTLDQWIDINRIQGRHRGDEIFLPAGISIVSLDDNLFNTDRSNLYCFATWAERMRWQKMKGVLVYNEDALRKLCTEYTEKQRGKLIQAQSSIVLE
jgi:hypothetical protein